MFSSLHFLQCLQEMSPCFVYTGCGCCCWCVRALARGWRPEEQQRKGVTFWLSHASYCKEASINTTAIKSRREENYLIEFWRNKGIYVIFGLGAIHKGSPHLGDFLGVNSDGIKSRQREGYLTKIGNPLQQWLSPYGNSSREKIKLCKGEKWKRRSSITKNNG